MSEYTAIRDVSETLRALLETHITNSSEPSLNGVPVDLRTPRELRENNVELAVSLWLYRLSRNGDLLNHPPPRPAPDRVLRAPLSLDLYYLVTPLARDPADEQVLMGKVLQVFNDFTQPSGSLLSGDLAGTGAKFRVVFDSLSMQDLTQIWQSLQESYQFSVTYVVQTVLIDSEREAVRTSPVLVRETEYDLIQSVK
jgi:hypothetical protein